jgi:hypothetical protein
MLVGNHIIFVFWVEWLQMWRHIDIVGRETVFAKVLEQVGVSWPLFVDRRVEGVLVLLIRHPMSAPSRAAS